MRDKNAMKIRALLKKYRTQALLTVLLALLTLMSYLIAGEPAADSLLLPEWATRYLLLPIALVSVILTVLRRYYVSLALFAGYHAGILLAAVGTDPGTEHLLYGRIVFFSVLLVALISGVWCEILLTLHKKWNSERDASS